MANFYLKGDAAGGGAGTDVSPFNSLLQAAPGGNFAGDTVLYLHPGTTIPAVFGGSWTLPAGANLTIRPYGSGDGRPSITFTGNGFLCQGSGSADYQDIDLYGTSGGSAIIARTGGNARAVNCDFHNFATSIKVGTGTIYVENVWCNKPSRNGLQVDAAADQPIATSVRVLNSLFTAASPTAQDLVVLHAGGYGLCTDAIVDGIRIEALGTAYIESGFDIQEQFKGTILRNSTIIGSSQWGIVMGSLVKTSRTYRFNTKAQMLAAFTREGVGSGAEDINGGHCVFVTADGGNNGIWQLTGDDPNVAGGWTGPMTAADLALTPNLIYSNLIQSCVAGVQIQHPGTQIVACNFLDTTMGNWVGETSSGNGYNLNIYPMGYDAKVMDSVFSSLNGKYPEIVSNGAGNIGVPSGNYLATSRAAVRVQALNSNIAQRTRLTMTGCVVRQRAHHTGPFIELAAAADRTYVDTDYNAYVDDESALRSVFASDGGTDRTFAAFKTSNGSSDANSQFIVAADALLDDECRLLDTSPLIGAGVARAGIDAGIPEVDAEGNAISSPPDIGAYRYLSEAVVAALVPTQRRQLRAQRLGSTPPVDSDPPAIPAGLAVASETAVSVTMSYNEAVGASYYVLRHSPTGEGTWTEEAQTSGLQATISGLQPGVGIDVQVLAGNAAGTLGWSATVSAQPADGVWFNPQNSSDKAGFTVMPAMTEKFVTPGATSNPGAYADPDFYTTLTDNGGAAGGVALIAVDDDVARSMDAVMSLRGMAAGQQWIVAGLARHVASGVLSVYWAYGAHSSLASMYGLQISAAGDIAFITRGFGASSSTTNTLVKDSGPVYADYDGEGTYAIVLDLTAVSTIAVDVQVLLVHPTVGTSVWTASAVDCSEGADAATLPGIISTAAVHGGLMLGARMRSAGAGFEPERLLGVGSGNSAGLGVFQARKHAAASSANALDAAEALLADAAAWGLR